MARSPRTVSYRDRGRAYSISFGLAGLALLVAGIVTGAVTGDWWVAVLAGIAVICAYGMYRSNERFHRENR